VTAQLPRPRGRWSGGDRGLRNGRADQLPHPGLIVGGDLRRFAIESPRQLDFADFRNDRAPISYRRRRFPNRLAAKGTAIMMGSSLDQMRRAGARLGAMPSCAAASCGTANPPAGPYRVVLGAQPVAGFSTTW
jgi:hypothetical protein